MAKALSGVVLAVVVFAPGLFIAHKLSDGPMGPISGGPLRAGPLVTDPNVDWAAALAAQRPGQGIELELVATGESRTVGAFAHDNALYVPCDLGFLWRRTPNAGMRFMGGLIYSVKHWNHDAEKDGRVVLRIDGKRYERQAVRVTDPELLAALRQHTEEGVERFFGARLAPGPADPDAIWFFRMDPRASG
ncbi:MAG TPA: hypothetical protein VMR86_08750 [Myxococcota bacterium]|nr:hypothetical protein [Myxococcota bacterium]